MTKFTRKFIHSRWARFPQRSTPPRFHVSQQTDSGQTTAIERYNSDRNPRQHNSRTAAESAVISCSLLFRVAERKSSPAQQRSRGAHTIHPCLTIARSKERQTARRARNKAQTQTKATAATRQRANDGFGRDRGRRFGSAAALEVAEPALRRVRTPRRRKMRFGRRCRGARRSSSSVVVTPAPCSHARARARRPSAVSQAHLSSDD